MANPSSDTGAWGATRATVFTLLSIGQTRLELLGNELEVARINAMRQLMLAQALLFCVGLGIVLTVSALALLFWEQRLLVIGIAGGLCWALALFCYRGLLQGAKNTEPLFNTSLAELQEDLRQLKAASHHGPTSG
jgi:uncharacterized membrane protein YqjE